MAVPSRYHWLNGPLSAAAASSAPAILSFQRATAVTLSSASPSIATTAATFLAVVSSTCGHPATGTVTFREGAQVLGSAPVYGGIATFTTTALGPGAHTITADYGGDALLDAASTSAQHTVVVSSISSLAPSALCSGASGATLVVRGAAFLPVSQVLVGGTSRATTYVDPTTLRAVLTASDLISAASVAVTVVIAPGLPESNAVMLAVQRDAGAPLVIPPEPLMLLRPVTRSGIAPTTPVSTPPLMAFLGSATATDDCSGVSQLPAMLFGSTPIDALTTFPAGRSPVLFRFMDNAGNIGSASSAVSVTAYGAIHGDSPLPGAADFLALLHVIKGLPVHNGTPPAGDLNGDGLVDASDLEILGQFLAGNIAVIPVTEVRP